MDLLMQERGSYMYKAFARDLIWAVRDDDMIVLSSPYHEYTCVSGIHSVILFHKMNVSVRVVRTSTACDKH